MSTAERDQDNAVEIESFTTGGVMRDKHGNEWLIPPEDDLSEEASFVYDPLYIPNKDDRFHYQYESKAKSELTEAEGFRPVMKSEIGLLSKDERIRVQDYGVANKEDCVHEVGDLRLFKIPKVLADRKQAAQARENARVVNSTEPPLKDRNLPDNASAARDRVFKTMPVEEEMGKATTFRRPKGEEV